jgi:Thiamine pyrophosphate enzyme, N-terminal TPP binding domain
MRRAEERGELRYVGIRHAGAASFAASGYAKLSGRPAACLAIAGPGSTKRPRWHLTHARRQRAGERSQKNNTPDRIINPARRCPHQ